MYINDVIRSVKRLYPSEYADEEMYIWCDEVSSMLAVEDRNVFKEAVLHADKNGNFLLPEGIGIENIHSVIAKGKSLKKSDIRNVFTHCSGYNTIRVVYLVPYYPIRVIKYRGEAVVSADGIKIPVNKFVPGDVINIDINCGEHTAEEVLLLETEYTKEMECILTITDTNIPQGEYADCVITRVVTDKTVCSAPYDSMYIDYILAKINMFQRDMQSYNHHMTAFNSRLNAYKKWLINHMPSCEGSLVNWW